jgi:small GTP-binding protein
MEKPIYLVVIGDTMVGKTSVIRTFTTGPQTDTIFPTIGIDSGHKKLVVDEVEHLITIWDTAGQERYRGISANYLRKAETILLFFAVDAPSSFDGLSMWEGLITTYTPGIPVILIGNKSDLAETRVVTMADAVAFAGDRDWSYCETSAKTGEGLQDLFTLAVRRTVEKRANAPNEPDRMSVDIAAPVDGKKKKKKNRC